MRRSVNFIFAAGQAMFPGRIVLVESLQCYESARFYPDVIGFSIGSLIDQNVAVVHSEGEAPRITCWVILSHACPN
jgi:hypothetical protein